MNIISLNRKTLRITIIIGLAVALVISLTMGIVRLSDQPQSFDGSRAFAHIEHQLSLGPRIPGSVGHAQLVDWLQTELEGQGWTTRVQETSRLDRPIRNIIATRGDLEPVAPWIILGAHYDTRIYADEDEDPGKRLEPVPGANDGASGVAVLLELARTIPPDYPGEVWLVFFDAEDNG